MNRGGAASRGEAWRAQQIAAAMRGIRSYLDAHPNASDSLRGVRLWLRDLPEEFGEEAIGAALDRLLELGEIEARPVAGGAVVYARALRERRQN